MPLLIGLGGLIIMSSVAIWLVMLLRLWSGQPILEAEPRKPVPWLALDLLVVLIVYLCAQVACLHLTAQWLNVDADLHAEMSPQVLAARLVANALANLLVVMTSVIYLRLRCGPGVGDMGFRPWRPLQDLTIGILAFAAAFAPVFAIQFLVTKLIPYEHPIQDLLTQVASPRMLLLCVVSAVLAAPLAEEFLFRVLLQGWMESVLIRRRGELGKHVVDASIPSNPTTELIEATLVESGNPYASPLEVSVPATNVSGSSVPTLMIAPIVVSSLAFAAVHFGNGPAPIPLFFLALVLGYVYQKTHRIWPSVVVHACLNGWSVALLWSQQV